MLPASRANCPQALRHGLDLAFTQGDQKIPPPKAPHDRDVRRRLATLPRLPGNFDVFDARQGQLLDAALDGRLQRASSSPTRMIAPPRTTAPSGRFSTPEI